MVLAGRQQVELNCWLTPQFTMGAIICLYTTPSFYPNDEREEEDHVILKINHSQT
jgi:hypothetical protein